MTSNSIYKEAYDKLEADLKELALKRLRLEAEIYQVAEEYDKKKMAMDGLKPLVNNGQMSIVKAESENEGKKSPIKWKQDALDFLLSKKGQWITSPLIFDNIVPDAGSLSKEERRKKMINLSLALSELTGEQKIESKNNEGGRGFVYQIRNEEASLWNEAS